MSSFAACERVSAALAVRVFSPVCSVYHNTLCSGRNGRDHVTKLCAHVHASSLFDGGPIGEHISHEGVRCG